MNASIIQGTRKNKLVDGIAWLIVVAVLAGTPLLVGALRTPPAVGPTLDPSVLYIFFTLLGLITLSMLGTYGMMAAKRIATPGGTNVLNLHAKFVGALFIISGFVKLQDPVGFGYKLDEYWDVFQGIISFFPNEFMKSISVYFAAFVSIIEVTLAIALMTGYKMRVTSTLLFLMILFFTFLTGFSAITGSVTDCGCFGDALKLTPMQSFLKDLLLTAAILPFYLLRRRIFPFYQNRLAGILTFVAFVVPAAISAYTYLHYPLLDFRGAYVVGQNLQYNASNPTAEGDLIAHDFSDFCMECGRDGFQGPTLYIILYNPHKASQEAMKAAADLAEAIKTKAPGIKVCTGTNIGPSGRAKLNLPFPEDFCFSSQDEKTLKTIVRSSPGYMMMVDGIIQKKWHYNDIPTVEELKGIAGPAANVPLPPIAPDPDLIPADSIGRDSAAIDSASHP